MAYVGDFNNITTPEEIFSGVDVTVYETHDMVKCLLTLGLTVMPSMDFSIHGQTTKYGAN